MTNLVIYNSENSQDITLSGLADESGTLISTANITASITRNGNVLSGGNLIFNAAANAGVYTASLNNFDAPIGRAEMIVVGSNAGTEFNFQVFVTIAQRTL